MNHGPKEITKAFFVSKEFIRLAHAVVNVAEDYPIGTGSVQTDAITILAGATAAYCGALAKQVVNEDGAAIMAEKISAYFRETFEEFSKRDEETVQ